MPILTGARWDADSGIMTATLSDGSLEATPTFRVRSVDAVAVLRKVYGLLGSQMTESEVRKVFSVE